MQEQELQELEFEINSERKRKLKYVSQRENWDCGVACFAMASSKTYQEARQFFKTRPTRGISALTLSKLLGGKKVQRFQKLKKLSDFFDDERNLILLVKYDEKDWGHYVLKDSEGYIYDPEDVVNPIEDFDREFVSFLIEL